MQETKAFWKSRGFWGPVIALVAFLSQQMGAGEIDPNGVVDIILYGFEVIGIVLAWIGRMRANARLGLRDMRATPQRPSVEGGARLQTAWFGTLTAITLALFAVGCTPQLTAAIGQGIEAARQAKDTEAEALKAAVCTTSIGAYHRVNNDQEKRALDVLCGGDYERPVTADDVRAIRDLGALFGGS